ncbi:MAG: lysophospholipase, partial [Lachnospiraceae bacterium]|nr:lysophospholipase [Lachnospiraceae bacterium]
LPETTVYVMAYYPVNTVDEFGLPKERHTDLFLTRTNEAIEQANKAVEAMAVEMGLRFINVNDGLKDADGNLKQEYSTEGLHMYPNAYWQILKNLRPYIEE